MFFCMIGACLIVACADLPSVRLFGGCVIFAGVHGCLCRWCLVASASRTGLAWLHECWCLVSYDKVLVQIVSYD